MSQSLHSLIIYLVYPQLNTYPTRSVTVSVSLIENLIYNHHGDADGFQDFGRDHQCQRILEENMDFKEINVVQEEEGRIALHCIGP